jgi:PmbA protein
MNDVTISLKKQAVRIINSNGVDVCARGTSAVIDIIVQEKNAVFYSYYYNRTKELDWPLEEEIEQWRSWPKKTVDISPGKVTVILSPAAFSQILDSVLTPVLLGDGPIESAHLSICDDGTLPGGMGTFPFDAEGVPQQKTALFNKGEISHLCDTTTGDMSGQKSTGNAVRQSFEESPYVYVTNLVVEPVEKTEELIKDTKDGILVNNILGGYIAHPPSGGFLCTISPGYRIQKEEIVGIVPPKTMEGTLSALLQSVPGDDTRAVDRYRTPSTQVAVDIYS